MKKYAPGKAKNQKCFKEISMSYETNDEITMDAYIEEKLNTKLPKLFFISQPMAGNMKMRYLYYMTSTISSLVILTDSKKQSQKMANC